MIQLLQIILLHIIQMIKMKPLEIDKKTMARKSKAFAYLLIYLLIFSFSRLLTKKNTIHFNGAVNF